MAKKKTVKISDINKEISHEIKTDENIDSLLNISNMLDTRIDLVKERVIILEEKIKKISGRMGLV
tara:strand:+ start:107 stop:301 length:195 start_codon:yes stop_codon:yes gene_type:complete